MPAVISGLYDLLQNFEMRGGRKTRASYYVSGLSDLRPSSDDAMTKDCTQRPCAFHSPLVDPPEPSVFSSPQSLDRGMVFSESSFSFTPQETGLTDDKNILHELNATHFQTPPSARSNSRRRRLNYRKSCRASARESYEVPFPKPECIAGFDEDFTMETDPEMPVLMAESDLVESTATHLPVQQNLDSSVVCCLPVKDMNDSKMKSFSCDLSVKQALTVDETFCDVPIDLTSPQGRNRRMVQTGCHPPSLLPPVSANNTTPPRRVEPAPVYSPISSTSGDRSPDHLLLEEVSPGAITSSFLDRFNGAMADGSLQYDSNASFWSKSFVNNFVALPSDAGQPLAGLNHIDSSSYYAAIGKKASCANNGSLYDQTVIGELPASAVGAYPIVLDYCSAYDKSQSDYKKEAACLPAQKIPVLEYGMRAVSDMDDGERDVDMRPPNIQQMATGHLSGQVNCRRTAEPGDIDLGPMAQDNTPGVSHLIF
jgi:hypothetical protein